MIKPAALMMAAVMAAITAGTYYGLDFLPQGLLPPPIGRVPPPPPPPLAPAALPAETVATAAPPAPAPAAKPAEPPVTEQDLAEEPPPKPQPAPAAAPAPAPAKTKPEPAPAATAAAPAPQPEPVKPEPAPAPKATKPKADPKAAPKQPTTVAKADEPSSAAPPKAKPPEADVIKPWWPDASKMPANQLKLMYAGQVKGEEAVALLFSAPLSMDTVKQHAQIKSADGENVSGNWELGKNPRLVVFRGLKAGRYTVILQPEIADDKGFMLGTTLKGPVYVQAPESQ